MLVDKCLNIFVHFQFPLTQATGDTPLSENSEEVAFWGYAAKPHNSKMRFFNNFRIGS